MADSGSIAQWWIDNAGVPPQVASAIARSAQVESHGDPMAFNAAGGGEGAVGTHQWRGARQDALKKLPDWQNPFVQQRFALSEVTGGDPQATKAWPRILAAKTEDEAYHLWRQNFARGEDVMQPEGTYGGATHINVRPQPQTATPPTDTTGYAILDYLLGKAGQGAPETQEQPDLGKGILDNLLSGRAGSPQASEAPKPPVVPPKPPQATQRPLDAPIQPIAPISAATPPPQPVSPPPPAPSGENIINHLLGIKPALTAENEAQAAPAQSPPTTSPPPPATPSAPSGRIMVGPELAGRVLLETGMQVIDMLLLQPLAAGARGVSGQDQPGTPEAIDDAIAGAGLAMTGSIGEGGLGAGPRLPARIEPPPIGHNMPPEPPLPAVGGGAGGAGGEEPPIWRGGSSEVMPPEPPLPAVGGGAGGAGGEEPPIWRGGSSEVAPDPRRPPAGSTREGRPEREMRREAARNEADELYKLQSQLTADRVAAKHFLDEVNEKFPMNPASQERIYHNIEEGDRNVPLTQAEKSYRDNIVRPLIEEGARVLQDIRGQGHPIDTDGYIHRITKNKGSMYDRMEGQRGRDVMGRRGLGRKTGAMEQLTMQGTTRDIEATTDVRYHKNALANSMDNLLRLKQVRRSIDYLKAMKPRLEEAGFATRPGVRPPSQRFQTTDIPQLQGWHFEPRIAHVLNDFYGSGQRGDSVFSAVNRVLTRAIVLNPLYHSWNVLNDWGIARGWDWLSPPGWASLGRDGFRALRDVASMNGNYLRVLRGGAGLRYGDAATRNFLEMMLKQMGGEIERNPTRWQQIARVTGFNSARELGRWIADKTNRSMFMIGDTFLVHRIYELQNKGMTLPEAIKEAEKHINNYRIPSEIMGSRRMSEFLQNRSLDAFSGYHYGLFKSYANMIKDVVKGTPAQRKVAAGQLLMLGLAVFVGYPLATAALRYITGDKDATVRRGGVPGLAQGAIDLMAPHRAVNLLGTNLELTQGQRDFTSELQSLITPAPALYLGGELATNTDFFTKQPIYDTQNLGHAGVEVGRKLLGEAPMARDIIDELIGRRGLGRIVGEEALPIRLPSPQDVMRRKKAEIERQKEMSRIWKSTKRALGLTGPAPTPDTGAPQ